MRIIFSFIFLLGLLFGAVFFARSQLLTWADQPLQLLEEQLVEIPRGISLKQLSQKLEEQGVVNSATWFRVWVRLFSKYSEFQAGPYRFAGTLSPSQIAADIRAGKVYRPIVLEVTIPEGFRLNQIVDRFVKAGVGTKTEFLSLVNSSSFLKDLGVPASSLEGFIYPATYHYYSQPSAKEVLRKGVEVFFEKLPQGYAKLVEAKGISLYEAVIFASLIELETRHDDERPLVSEVIWSRYNDGVALGIDAAIIYGIEDYRGDLTFRHLRDKNNPYNTRVHLGFPPTPIGSPSQASLQAVLSPSSHGYYYYVVDPAKGDRHHFSKTLKEHNRWVSKLKQSYRQKRREARANERKERLAQRAKEREMRKRARERKQAATEESQPRP